MTARFPLVAAALLLGAGVHASNEFHVGNEFSVTYNDVSGPGKGASFLTEDARYLEVLNLYGRGQGSGWDYNYSLGLKATDDKRNDVKTVSLTNLNGVFRKSAHTLTTGDLFDSFSQYTLATSLKGASYKYARNGSRAPEVTTLFGYAYPRWDSVWREPLTRAVTRRAYGARVKESFSDSAWAGINYVRASDTGRVRAGDALYDASNLSVDLGLAPLSGLTLTAEHALSDSEEKSSRASETGSATKIELVGDADPSRVSLEFEEVDPDFESPLGSAVPDRRKAKAKWRFKRSRFTTFDAGLLWYRNNLPGSAAADTTQNWRPELGMSVKRILPARPHSFLGLSYKFDRKYNDASSQADHYVNTNFRDRFGGIDSDTNLGYTRYRTKSALREADEVNANTALHSRHEKGSWVFKPQVSLGSWYSDDDVAGSIDKVYEYSAGIGLERPESNVTCDLRAGQNLLEKGDAAADDSARFFASLGAYWKTRTFGADSTFFLRAGYNTFAFTTAARDFREKTATAGVNTRF